jgi:hypothetical protein
VRFLELRPPNRLDPRIQPDGVHGASLQRPLQLGFDARAEEPAPNSGQNDRWFRVFQLVRLRLRNQQDRLRPARIWRPPNLLGVDDHPQALARDDVTRRARASQPAQAAVELDDPPEGPRRNEDRGRIDLRQSALEFDEFDGHLSRVCFPPAHPPLAASRLRPGPVAC